MMHAEPVLKMDAIIGEGPLWHSIHKILYWVDIEKKLLHGFEPHTNLHREWSVLKRIGAVVAASNGNLILALQGEIAEMDIITGAIRTLTGLESNLPENRCNDGKCDPAGRLWIGTMHLDCKPGAGSLYCIDKPLHISKVLTNLTIANGMGWSPDGKYMYFIDSEDRDVKRFNFRKDRVALEEAKIILSFKNPDELPDGMCVDSEGMLWIAFWGGKRVGRYDPKNGRQLAEIEVSAPHVTSCCFGGEDLQTLYITTARQGLSPKQLDNYPLSGSVFACRTDVKGADANFFGENG